MDERFGSCRIADPPLHESSLQYLCLRHELRPLLPPRLYLGDSWRSIAATVHRGSTRELSTLRQYPICNFVVLRSAQLLVKNV